VKHGDLTAPRNQSLVAKKQKTERQHYGANTIESRMLRENGAPGKGMHNSGFGRDHYVPVLKWKRGEYLALQELGQTEYEGITPLIEVPDTPENFDEEALPKTIQAHLSQIPDQLAASVGVRRAFIDVGAIEEESIDDVHPLEWLFDRTNESIPGLIPVTSPRRSDSHQAAVRKFQTGACVRLGIDDFSDEDNIGRVLLSLRQNLALEPRQIDIVFDLQAVDPAQTKPLRAIVRRSINEFPDRDMWRSMTIVGTGFPVDLAGVNGVEEIPRTEFYLWENLVSEKAPARIPTFGDYTASYFESAGGDPRLLTPSANIRYTLGRSWLIVKGGPIRGPWAKKYGGSDQYYSLSAKLVGLPEFMGEEFSWGDKYIARCARRQASKGNPTTWRQVAVNHHVTFVQRQVSSWISPEVGS